MARDAFHCPFVICKSRCKPAIFAFPMLVLSKKEIKYLLQVEVISGVHDGKF